MQTASNHANNNNNNNNNSNDDAGAPRRIVPLPLAVTARLRSTLTITSLTQAISELVQNSLDAHSRHIKIQANFLRNSCVVEDDGCGISPDDVPLLGKRYATSKYYHHERKPPSTFGHLGITLASLAASSTLTVLTRASTHRSTSLVRFSYSESPIPSSVGNHAPDHLRLPYSGTTIRLEALFGNLPVRLKAQQASLDEEREWEKLKRVLVALLLARDGGMPNVGMTLRDASGSRKTVIKPRLAGDGEIEEHEFRDGRVIQTHPELRLLQQVYTPKEIGSVSCWEHVRAGRGNVMIEGWICTTGSPSRRYQFISLNSYPLLPPPHSTNVLHATLNQSFSKSTFGVVIDPLERGIKSAQKPRKGVDRYAKCVLRITCTREEQESNEGDYHRQVLIGGEGGTGDNSSGKGGVEGENLKRCVELLQRLVDQFLKLRGFQKQAGTQDRMGEGEVGTSDDEETEAGMNGVSTQEAPSKTESHKRRHLVLGSCPSLPRASSVNSNIGARTSSVANEPSIPLLFGWGNKVKSAMRDPVEEQGRQVVGMPKQLTNTDTISVSTIGNTPLVITIPDDSDDEVDNGDVKQEIEDNEDVGRLEVEDANVDNDNYLHWHNPVTNHETMVNTRTGNARLLRNTSNHHRPGQLMAKRISLCSNRSTAASEVALRDEGVKRLKFTTTMPIIAQPCPISPVTPASNGIAFRHENPSPKRGAFMSSILEKWKNPVFPLQSEPPIPALGPTQALLALEQHSEHYRGCSSHFFPSENQSGLKEMMLQSLGIERLSKEGLRRGRVIGQVDKKFVLMVVRASDGVDDCGELLVAIDQHAADERWRVEKLMEDLCRENVVSDTARDRPSTDVVKGEENRPIATEAKATETSGPAQAAYSASSVPFNTSFKYPITSQEYEMLSQQRYKAEFAVWGVYYNLTPSSEQQQDYTLTISHLPRILVDRGILEPTIPIDLLRGHLWDLSERSLAGWVTTGLNKPSESNVSSWVERMRFAPKKLVEIVNSKACRSAIMFGDFLSVWECEELVGRLVGREVGDDQQQEGNTIAEVRFNVEDAENERLPPPQQGCKFPFMCAHGRPSMIPLVKMSSNATTTDFNVGYHHPQHLGNVSDGGYTCNNLGLGVGFAGNGDGDNARGRSGDTDGKGVMWVGRRRYARFGGESGPGGGKGKREEMGGYKDVYRKWRERERERMEEKEEEEKEGEEEEEEEEEAEEGDD